MKQFPGQITTTTKISKIEEKNVSLCLDMTATYRPLVPVAEVVLDEQCPQGLPHVPVQLPHAVAPGAQKLGHAGHVHVHLAVSVDVIPGQVLHVAVRQSPDQIVVQDSKDTNRKNN